MAAAGIRPEQGWLTTGARGGNLLAGVRGLALFGLPIPNITASAAQALALADWSDPTTPPDELGLAIEEGRAVRKKLEIGVCGEHGGDPKSIHLCHKLGVDYVSCSPFRVPIARLAAAHAVLGTK